MRSVACCGMREGISIEASAADRDRLERIAADRNSPQKRVWRARIILATAHGCGTAALMRRTEVSKPCVWRWQERFMREGVAGLLRDKTRPPGLPPLPQTVIDRVVELTPSEPPGETTHGICRAMAAVAAYRCARCSVSGRRTVSSRTGSGPSSSPRSAVRGQAARRRRPLSRPADAQPRSRGRREVPDPGARADAGGPGLPIGRAGPAP